MNLLLLDPGELAGDGRVTLEGRRARHVREVLKAAPGRTVRVGVVGGPLGTAEVRAVAEDAVRLEVRLDAPPSPRPPVDLVLALPRPKALRRLLRTLAAVGVGRLDLVNAWRVEKSYFDSPAVTPEALEQALRLGCEQGGTTWVPEVRVHRLLMPFLEAQLGPEPGPAEGRIRVLLDPGAGPPLEAVVPPGTQRRVCLAVGPEGGWIDRERASLRERGFLPARLGAPVLTTGDAVVTGLAQLSLLRRLSAAAGPTPPPARSS